MPLTKALIIDRDAFAPVPVPVMFNPPDYQLQKTNQFAEIEVPGLGSSTLQFVRGSTQTLTMELFFDTTSTGIDVRTRTELVVRLMAQKVHTHAPPRLLFIWGSLIFPCVLESVTQRFEVFNPVGMPLRARLNVTFRGFDALDQILASIPLESTDRTKRWLVKAGDTLQRIAAQEYGDPRRWRPIAEANAIDNPLSISPGQVLILPVLAEGANA